MGSTELCGEAKECIKRFVLLALGALTLGLCISDFLGFWLISVSFYSDPLFIYRPPSCPRLCLCFLFLNFHSATISPHADVE